MQVLDGKANHASNVFWQCRVLHNWSHVVCLTELLCKPAKSVPMTFTSLSGQRKERRMSWIDGRMEGRISVIFTTALLPSLVTDTQTHNCFPSTRRGRYADPWGWGQCCTWSWYIQHDASSVYHIIRLWLGFLMRHFLDIVSNIVAYHILISWYKLLQEAMRRKC